MDSCDQWLLTCCRFQQCSICIGCPDLSVANGQTTYSNEYSSSVRPVGTIAYTSCDSGHYPNGDSTNRTCLNGGIWSGIDTVCSKSPH